MTEAQHQTELFKWAELVKCKYPELKLLYHIPNGGKRDKIEAAHLKQQGVKSGVPDICLPVARGEFNSLYIELKAEKGKVSENQKSWLSDLRREGNRSILCHGWIAAKQVIEEYLNLKEV